MLPRRTLKFPRLKTPSTGMEELDRLSWAATISGVAYGVRIGIRTTDASMLERSPPWLPPTWKGRPLRVVDHLFSWVAGKRMNRAYSGPTEIGRSADPSRLIDALESSIGLDVAASSPKRIFVHAGVVGWKGQAILFPGKSFAGKSTLVAALVRAGATYYSDEYAVLDERGWVHPYPRRISLRVAQGRPNRRCWPAELGGTTGEVALPVGLVVVSRYRAGASWRPKELSGGRAVLELLAHTVPARLRPKAALATLSRVARQALTVKGLRGEAERLAAQVLGRGR